MSSFNMNSTVGGLVSVTTSIPQAGTYPLTGKLSLPTIVDGGGPSAVVVTLSQNGTPFYTGPAGAEGFSATASCAANDTLTVAMTSANANDALPNMVKTTISIG